jgi:hypothetical protein
VYHFAHRGEPEGRLVVLGEGPVQEVLLEETGQRFELGAERQRMADQACREWRARGRVVTVDPIYRLLEYTVGERLTLRVERGDYSQVVGTKSHPEWGLKAQVIAVCCALECPQGFVVEQRSERVAAAPGKWHISPSGSMQPPCAPWDTLLAEAGEELGLAPQEIEDARCVGMLYGETSGVYQLACSARVGLTLPQMLSRSRRDAWEAVGHVCAPVDPEALPEWMARQRERLTPGGRAVLLAEGRRRWGLEWFDRHCEDVP